MEDDTLKVLNLFIIIIILISFSTSNAQIIQFYGAKAGVAITNQDFVYNFEFKPENKHRTGLNIGLFVEWFQGSPFSLVTEVHYIQKGMLEEQIMTGESSPEPIATLKFDNRVDYLSIPILVKLILVNKNISPYFTIDPRLDFKIGYKSDFNNDIYNNFKKVNVGGNLGFGAESGLFLIELRHNLNFISSYKTELLIVKNNSFEVLYGLKL